VIVDKKVERQSIHDKPLKRIYDSDVNKAKFLSPRPLLTRPWPRSPEVNKCTWRI